MTMKLFILVVILVGIALVLLCINILVKKDGRFPETHIGKNVEMRKRGIHCVR